MKDIFYSDDRATQIVLELLKAHGIKRVVASPGVTCIAINASMQQDSYFEMFSCVDERSAAYMACGIAAQTGEPVIITCTEATASRNYMPALTEAYYRKLPIVVITGNHGIDRTGQLYEQVIDRSLQPKDIVRISVNVDSNFPNAELANTLNVNKALLELKHHGGGPVHINLASRSFEFNTKKIAPVRKIDRIMPLDSFPEMKGRVAIYIGAHRTFTEEETMIIDKFCADRDSIVICNHTSGYHGKYRVNMALAYIQKYYNSQVESADIAIHLGETGSYNFNAKQVWRVSEDGELRDPKGKLRYLFEMDDLTFFKHYILENITPKDNKLNACRKQTYDLLQAIPELPLSNLWLAQQFSSKIPKNSILHFAILNSYRCWNFFDIDPTVETNCNVGGFGIDGNMSSLIGASFVAPDKLCFLITGDLAFFYDLNSLGNRHIGNNVRILLVNNGKGEEFRNYGNPGYKLGELAEPYIAAGGHYGNKSPELVKNYVEAMGYEYMSATTKDEVLNLMPRFLNPKELSKPLLFEIFTDGKDESDSLKIAVHLMEDVSIKRKEQFKNVVKEGISIIENIMK